MDSLQVGKNVQCGETKKKAQSRKNTPLLFLLLFKFIKCYKQLKKISTFRMVFKTVRTYTNHAS